jgi:hypothetical protein
VPRKGLYLVFSRPVSDDPEVVAAYERWYDEVHVAEALLLPGFVRGRHCRLAELQLLPGKATAPGFDYVTVYEVDDIDKIPEAQALLPKLAEVSTELFSPAMDRDSVRSFVFEQLSDITEPAVLPEGVALT